MTEKGKVQLVGHLDDLLAPVPRAVEPWNYSVFDGLERFIYLSDSPYHGL